MYIYTSLLSLPPSSLLCVCSSVFLVCPMKNVPLVVKRRHDQYRHTPLPTDGEVMSVYMFVYILPPNYLCVFRERRQKASACIQTKTVITLNCPKPDNPHLPRSKLGVGLVNGGKGQNTYCCRHSLLYSCTCTCLEFISLS